MASVSVQPDNRHSAPETKRDSGGQLSASDVDGGIATTNGSQDTTNSLGSTSLDKVVNTTGGGTQNATAGGATYGPTTGYYEGTMSGGQQEAFWFDRNSEQDLSAMGISLALWLYALYLLKESLVFQAWCTPSDPKAPKADRYVNAVFMWSFATFAVWTILETTATVHWANVHHRDLTTEFFADLGHFGRGMALAALLPLAVAIYKFMLASTMIRAANKIEGAPARSASTPLVGALVGLIGLISSIATLIDFFHLRSGK